MISSFIRVRHLLVVTVGSIIAPATAAMAPEHAGTPGIGSD